MSGVRYPKSRSTLISDSFLPLKLTLTLYRPITAFHCDHTASIIARKNNESYANHQVKSRSIFTKLKNSEKFNQGDTVKLKLMKTPFRKEQSTFHPKFSLKTYKIKRIDLSTFPPLYELEDFPIESRR